jgi:DNA-binding IclR family transcriptional regulator
LSQPVRAVERALDILSCFNHSELALSLTQIADRVGMNMSTVHRLLGTLENKHFVRRSKTTGLYHLSFRFVEMASLVLQELDLQRWAQPYLQRLSSECGETVDLAVLDGTQVIYLQVVEGAQRVKIAAAMGQRLPAHCTASGKAFLAYLPDEQVSKILSADLTRYTRNTAVSLPAVYESLRVTRERGFAISEREYEEDISAVAAPILDANGYPLAVIAIAGPSYRLTQERMLALGRSIRVSNDAITREMGLATLSAFISNTATGTVKNSTQRG